ncbi:MAG: hypothetical protein ABIJ56_22305 [Pseudomonadota bacterium]
METFFSLCGTFIFLAFPLGIIAFVFILGYVMRQQHAKSWGVFARAAGLILQPGGWFKAPTVSGTYGGFNMYLYTYTQGSGKNKTTYTSMVIYLPMTNQSHVRVTREGFFSKITKAFGAQDIPIGDPAFDAAYIIKSDTPQYVQSLLTPQLRGTMLASSHPDLNFTVSRGTVFYSRVGVEKNAQMLRFLLDLLVMVSMRVVEMEAGAQALPHQPAQQPSLHLPPVTVCQNCGAELKWEADKHQGVATCEYCGKEMTFRFGTKALRRQ